MQRSLWKYVPGHKTRCSVLFVTASNSQFPLEGASTSTAVSPKVIPGPSPRGVPFEIRRLDALPPTHPPPPVSPDCPPSVRSTDYILVSPSFSHLRNGGSPILKRSFASFGSPKEGHPQGKDPQPNSSHEGKDPRESEDKIASSIRRT